MAEVVAYVNAEAIKAREEESRREKLIDFTGLLHRQSQYPSAGGGFADIWEALWQRELTTCKVLYSFFLCIFADLIGSCSGGCQGTTTSR